MRKNKLNYNKGLTNLFICRTWVFKYYFFGTVGDQVKNNFFKY